MGFGIATIGYAFLIANEVGGGVIAALMLGYGMFLASRLEIGFLRASVSALFMLPRGVVQLCSLLGLFDVTALPMLNTVTYLLNLGAWFLMSYFWLSSVAKIARDNKAARLERQARNRIIFTSAFIMTAFAAEVLKIGNVTGGLMYWLTAAQYILQYAVIIVSTVFMHTCFVLITSEKQYQRDKQDIAKEQAKALEKRHREEQEAKRRIGK